MNSRSSRAWKAALTGACALICFTACSTVTTLQPLSAPEVPAEKEKLEGTWVHTQAEGGDAIPLELHFSSSGVAQLAGVDWRDDSPTLEVMEAIFTPGKRAGYLSLRDPEGRERGSDRFFPAQWKLTEEGKKGTLLKSYIFSRRAIHGVSFNSTRINPFSNHP